MVVHDKLLAVFETRFDYYSARAVLGDAAPEPAPEPAPEAPAAEEPAPEAEADAPAEDKPKAKKKK